MFPKANALPINEVKMKTFLDSYPGHTPIMSFDEKGFLMLPEKFPKKREDNEFSWKYKPQYGAPMYLDKLPMPPEVNIHPGLRRPSTPKDPKFWDTVPTYRSNTKSARLRSARAAKDNAQTSHAGIDPELLAKLQRPATAEAMARGSKTPTSARSIRPPNSARSSRGHATPKAVTPTPHHFTRPPRASLEALGDLGKENFNVDNLALDPDTPKKDSGPPSSVGSMSRLSQHVSEYEDDLKMLQKNELDEKYTKLLGTLYGYHNLEERLVKARDRFSHLEKEIQREREARMGLEARVQREKQRRRLKMLQDLLPRVNRAQRKLDATNKLLGISNEAAKTRKMGGQRDGESRETTPQRKLTGPRYANVQMKIMKIEAEQEAKEREEIERWHQEQAAKSDKSPKKSRMENSFISDQ